ncbi:hypothetical protein ADM96_01550 [Burkholderia sp. ST111]|nr:hypothetical protein ADM96_01550 [Burkholderia sp. ST111]
MFFGNGQNALIHSLCIAIRRDKAKYYLLREKERGDQFTSACKVVVRLVKAQCVAYGHTWVTDHEFEI